MSDMSAYWLTILEIAVLFGLSKNGIHNTFLSAFNNFIRYIYGSDGYPSRLENR